MMDDVLNVLRQAALFEGLSQQELQAIAALSQPRTFHSGEIITTQGEHGDELFVVSQGFVEVTLMNPAGGGEPRTVVQLGPGQIVGEMSLVDRGPRSATVRSLTDGALLHALKRDAFLQLCQTDTHLGYLVMRNMAADLSFKLRHRMLTGR
jgi:CRP-like cAMP-binding protein